METLLHYFLKVNGLLIVFYWCYYFFLRHETFFQNYRWFLILGILSSFLFPLITFTEIIWIHSEPAIKEPNNFIFIESLKTEIISSYINWQILFMYGYFLVSLLLLFRISFEIYSFFKLIKSANIIKEKNIFLVETKAVENPFSFFNYLVFNKYSFSEEELELVFIHEKIHMQQKHSIDVLIGKLLCMILWINPIAWLYQKAIKENLEFITDRKTATISNKFYQYQKTLLKVVTNPHQLTITNPFYQSLIKKRIVMLNKNQSQKKNVWKYAIVVPMLVVFLLLFQIKTIAQVKDENENTKKIVTEAVALAVIFVTDKNATDAEMQFDSEELNKQGINYKFSKVKRNKKGEIIALKIEYNDGKGNKGVREIKGAEPIEPVYFSSRNNNIGFTNAPTVSESILDENISKNVGTAVKVKKTSANKTDNAADGVNWEDVVKIQDYDNLTNQPNKKQLYIINGKEYTSTELKNKKVEVDGSIIHYFKEEAIQKFGKKGKNGVLVFEGKSVILEGDKNMVSYSANKFKNIEPKNQKLIFLEGKEYIINGKKYSYKDLKDRNWWIYTGTIHKIEEKNNIITIIGDIVLDAEQFNTQESIFIGNSKKIEHKKFTLENGNSLFILNNETIKITKYPNISLLDVKIEIDGIEDSYTYESFKNYNLNSFKEIKVIEAKNSKNDNFFIKKIILKTK